MKCCSIFLLGVALGFFLEIYIRQMLEMEKCPPMKYINGVLYVWICMVNGFDFTGILFCLCTSTLLVLSVIDVQTYEIPALCNIVIGILGIVRMVSDFLHWYDYMLGFFCTGIFLWLLFWLSKGTGMGGGDVKLMAASGLLLGVRNNLFALTIGAGTALVIHVLLMMHGRRGRRFAFGPYLSFGIFVSMLCRG